MPLLLTGHKSPQPQSIGKLSQKSAGYNNSKARLNLETKKGKKKNDFYDQVSSILLAI